ncbi:MAG: flavodoxin domain-containing protein [Methanomicrobiales archaeon]
MQILVAFATRKGSTGEIASAIGKELEGGGQQVKVSLLKDTSSPEGYDAAVLGAPVYTGHIDDDLRKFVDRNKNGLKNIPVAAFAVGLAPVDHKIGSPEDLEKQLRTLASPVKLVAITVFAGKLDTAQHSFMTKTMISLMKAPTGDFRDWDVIREWAKSLPGLFGTWNAKG